MTYPQLHTLQIIQAISRRLPCFTVDIARVRQVTTPAASEVVWILIDRGYVKATQEGLCLTDKGIDATKKA